MSEIFSAMRLPSGINVEPEAIKVADDVDTLYALMGTEDLGVMQFLVSSPELGHTVLTAVMAQDLNNRVPELIRSGELSMVRDANLLAGALMQEDEPLVGTFIIFGAQNPDTLQVDGGTYDVPRWVFELSESITVKAAETWNEVVEGIQTLAAALEQGVLDEDVLTDVLATDDVAQGSEDIGRLLEHATDALDQLADVNSEQFIKDLEAMLADEAEGE